MQGTGGTWAASPVPKLHRQMAVDFLENYYPVEYREWMAEQDPQRIEYLSDVDGNDYWEAVSGWIDREAESMGYEDWDPDEASEEWYAWKDENEPSLIDNLEGPIEEPQQLNMSYNTSYASDIMIDLIEAHYGWMSELEDKSNGTLGIEEDSLQFSVRNFFNEKYR